MHGTKELALKDEITLRDFVAANEALLAAFGVFAGLSVVFFQSHDEFVAVVSFLLAIVLLWEILEYPLANQRRKLSRSCGIFKLGVLVIMIVLAGHLAETSLVLARANLRILSIALIFVPLYVAGRTLIDIVREISGLSRKSSPRTKSRLYQIGVGFLLGIFLMILYYFSQYLVGLLGVS
jgi:hypothetical protein